MSENDQQNNDKPAKKNTAGSKGRPRGGQKLLGEVNAADKPEEELKTKRPKQKAASGINKASNEVAHGYSKFKIESPKSETDLSKSEIKPQTSEIEHPKSEIPMEVHHHPDLEHKPKPIKEYLLEGFMIFIAVMMGFVAENIREAIDNSDQAKHLTEQLVHDLRADTAQLNYINSNEGLIVKYNDTLFNMLQQPMAKIDTRHLQKMVANSHSMWLFHPSAGAIAAIKNQLHLKQFTNSELINYFSKYERHIELLHIAQDINLQYQRTYLDPFTTQHFTPANLVAAFDNAGHPTAQMRNLTQPDLDQLATDMVMIRLITREMVTDNRMVKADAVDLLQYVKKQYGVDGE
jgi:hypothetical protein